MHSRGKRVFALSLSSALFAGCANLNLGLLAGALGPSPAGSAAPSAGPSPAPTPGATASANPQASPGSSPELNPTASPTAAATPAATYAPPLFTPTSFAPFELFGKETALGIHAAGTSLVADHGPSEQALSTDGGQTWVQAPHPLTPFGYRIVNAGTEAWAVGVQQQGQSSFIRVYRLAGTSWVDTSAGLLNDFYSPAVSGSTLYLVGALGTYRRTGSSWTPLGTPKVEPPESGGSEPLVPIAAAVKGNSLLALYRGASDAQLYSLDLAVAGSTWLPIGSALNAPGYRVSMAISGDKVLVGTTAGVATLDTALESPTWAPDASVPEAALFTLPSGVYRAQLPGQQGAPPAQSYGKLEPDGTWSANPVPGLGVVGLAERSGYLYAAAISGLFRRPVAGGAWERVVIDAYPTAAFLIADGGKLYGGPADAASAKVIPLSGGTWVDLGLPTAADGLTSVGSFGARLAAFTLKFGPNGPDNTTAKLYLRLEGLWQSLDLPAAPTPNNGMAGYQDGKAWFYRPEAGGLRLESRTFPGTGDWAQAGPDLPLSTTDQAAARVAPGNAWVVKYKGGDTEIYSRSLDAGGAWQTVPINKDLLGSGTGGLAVFDGHVYLYQAPGDGGPTRIFHVAQDGLRPTANLDLRSVSEPRLDSDGYWLYACGLTGQGNVAFQRMPLDGEHWEQLGAAPPAQATTLGGCTVDRGGKRLFVSTSDGIWVSQ